MKITKENTIKEILEMCPSCAPVFMEYGMHCLGCAIAAGETLEQAAAMHNVNLEEMLLKLNATLERSEV